MSQLRKRNRPVDAEFENLVRSLGQRIKAVREERKISQSELAKRAHIHQKRVSELEAGKVIDIRYVYAAAKGLNIPLSVTFELPQAEVA